MDLCVEALEKVDLRVTGTRRPSKQLEKVAGSRPGMSRWRMSAWRGVTMAGNRWYGNISRLSSKRTVSLVQWQIGWSGWEIRRRFTGKSSWLKEGLGLVWLLNTRKSTCISEIGGGTENQQRSYIDRVYVQL